MLDIALLVRLPDRHKHNRLVHSSEYTGKNNRCGMGKIRSMTPSFQSPILPVIGIAVAPCPAHSYKRVLIFKLPFKLIVVTAWLASPNVDLFIRGIIVTSASIGRALYLTNSLYIPIIYKLL